MPVEMIEMLSWQKLPKDGTKVWIYVPYAPRVVSKYGVDGQGLPKCSGPDLPDGLEGGGLNFVAT